MLRWPARVDIIFLKYLLDAKFLKIPWFPYLTDKDTCHSIIHSMIHLFIKYLLNT